MKRLKQALEKARQWFAGLRKMRIRARRRLYATIIALLLSWACIHFYWNETPPADALVNTPAISYSQFLGKVDADEIAEVRIGSDTIVATLKDGTSASVKVNSAFASPVEELRKYNVVIAFGEAATDIVAKAKNYAPVYVILIALVWGYFFLRGIGPQGEIHLKFWKRPGGVDLTRRTFADVMGIDEAKAELQEVVDFLKNPERFEHLGGRVPQGILLIGPPGTGKTLLARAVAGEAGVPFFSESGSGFVEMFVGVGARRIRKLFEDAKANVPCIIYIDEVDSIAARRMGPTSGGDREYGQATNQLLVELDGFKKSPGIIFIASTNRPENLDEAFLRPGRIDRQIMVPPPDARGREAILKIHTRKLSLAPDVDLVSIALGTPGFSGADLENLANEAALAASRERPLVRKVCMRHFAEAKEKVMVGAERKSLVVTEADKRRTAYHEVGHALVAMQTPGSDPVEKISIMPRGRTLGVTIQLPSADRHHYTKSFLTGRMAVMMGGRAAEEIFFDGDVSAGAESDFEEATKLASSMVCRWGMSDIGPMTLKKGMGGAYDCSPALAFKADKEIAALATRALETARSIIENERDAVQRIAEALVERTNISGAEIQHIIDGRELPKMGTPSPDG